MKQRWRLTPESSDAEVRRRSFGDQAAQYHAVRPGYPTELVEWLVGDPPKKVVELGAGTGLLTRQLLELGHHAVGVEPDAQMLAHGLSVGLPLEAGSAESIPAPDGDADAVIVGQAWHWFDPSAAVREVSRVLRPGGHLGLLWNLRDESEPWVAELGRIVGGEDRTSVEGAEAPPALDDGLGRAAVRRARHTQRLTAEQMVELAGTWSYVAQNADRAQVLASVEALLSRCEREAGTETHELPYVCIAARYMRR